MKVNYYTDEQHKFFREYIPGHTYKEIAAEFNRRFERQIEPKNVKGYMANHHINNGLKGRFKKGQVSHNKGKKGLIIPGSEKGWFKKGNVPHNAREVGTIIYDKHIGYMKIKIAEPNKWKFLHRYVYEKAYGPVPPKHAVTFRDGNRKNCNLDNLILVKKSALVRMNQQGTNKLTGEEKETAILLAELTNEMARIKREQKQ